MSIYITPQDELHVEYQGIALDLPALPDVDPFDRRLRIPKFEELSRRKPKHIGIVFRCDACGEPVFLKFTAKSLYGSARRTRRRTYAEIERARENFPLTYLPDEAEALFKEALELLRGLLLQCVWLHEPAHGAIAVLASSASAASWSYSIRLQEIRAAWRSSMTTLFRTLRAVLFGSDSDPWPNHPNLNAERAGILLEVMRDLFYQTFVRKARLIAGGDLPQFCRAQSGRSRLTDEHPGIAEQPHPSPIFRPFLRRPRVLNRTEHPFRVGHQRGHAAVGAAQARQTHCGTVRVAGYSPWADRGVDVLQAHLAGRSAAAARSGIEFGAALAMGYGDRQHRFLHAAA